jgi:hypothetical protein
MKPPFRCFIFYKKITPKKVAQSSDRDGVASTCSYTGHDVITNFASLRRGSSCLRWYNIDANFVKFDKLFQNLIRGNKHFRISKGETNLKTGRRTLQNLKRETHFHISGGEKDTLQTLKQEHTLQNLKWTDTIQYVKLKDIF